MNRLTGPRGDRWIGGISGEIRREGAKSAKTDAKKRRRKEKMEEKAESHAEPQRTRSRRERGADESLVHPFFTSLRLCASACDSSLFFFLLFLFFASVFALFAPSRRIPPVR
jgi:hypothetical protein